MVKNKPTACALGMCLSEDPMPLNDFQNTFASLIAAVKRAVRQRDYVFNMKKMSVVYQNSDTTGPGIYVRYDF